MCVEKEFLDVLDIIIDDGYDFSDSAIISHKPIDKKDRQWQFIRQFIRGKVEFEKTFHNLATGQPWAITVHIKLVFFNYSAENKWYIRANPLELLFHDDGEPYLNPFCEAYHVVKFSKDALVSILNDIQSHYAEYLKQAKIYKIKNIGKQDET